MYESAEDGDIAEDLPVTFSIVLNLSSSVIMVEISECNFTQLMIVIFKLWFRNL